MASLVQHFLENCAERLPSKTALVCEGQRLTYGEIEGMANQFAHALIAVGVRRGDRVGILLPNSIHAVVAIFAVLKAGGVFVPINPTTKKEKLLYILNNCRATAVIGEASSFLAQLVTDGPQCPLAGLLGLILHSATGPDSFTRRGADAAWEPVSKQFENCRPPCVTIDLDLACLVYTSGSTGEPKGVMCDHSAMVFASASILEYLGASENDCVINVLPLSFDYGLYQLLMTFRIGGTLVLEKSFAFPAATLKLMEREHVTGFPGVPTMYAMLVAMDLSTFDLSSLRYLTNTAAALPVAHIEEIRKKFPGVLLFSMYGLTETKRTLYLPPAMLDEKPGSVGIPIPGTEAWLVNEQGERLPHGASGELVVRGRHVMRGYWQAAQETLERFRSGAIPGERFCFTGDLFRTDEDGYFYFVGRKDDIIKSRGEKVPPREIENVLHGIEGVVHAAVIGVPDPILGHAIKALLVVKRSMSEREVLAYCRAHLEDYMMPKLVEFRDSLPLTPSGKIDKRSLS